MLTLNEKSEHFGVIECPVNLKPGWYYEDCGHVAAQAILSSPCVLKTYNALFAAGLDDIVGTLAAHAERTAALLGGWDPGRRRELRSAFWRSSHRFLVDNIDLVDRGRELDELAKLMRVSR